MSSNNGGSNIDFQNWIEGIDGLASLYSFDILEDGAFSEIRLMAVNKQNTGMLQIDPRCTGEYDIREAIKMADEQMYLDKAAYYRNHLEKDRRARKSN